MGLRQIAEQWLFWLGVVACYKQLNEDKLIAFLIFVVLVAVRVWKKQKDQFVTTNPFVTRNGWGVTYKNPNQCPPEDTEPAFTTSKGIEVFRSKHE